MLPHVCLAACRSIGRRLSENGNGKHVLLPVEAVRRQFKPPILCAGHPGGEGPRSGKNRDITVAWRKEPKALTGLSGERIDCSKKVQQKRALSETEQCSEKGLA